MLLWDVCPSKNKDLINKPNYDDIYLLYIEYDLLKFAFVFAETWNEHKYSLSDQIGCIFCNEDLRRYPFGIWNTNINSTLYITENTK